MSSAGANRLNYTLKTLRKHWEETETHWQDQMREDFERKHVEPLIHQVSATARAMTDLADVIAKVRRECS